MEPRRAVINLPAMGSFQNSRIAERRGGSSLSSHTSVSLGFFVSPEFCLGFSHHLDCHLLSPQMHVMHHPAAYRSHAPPSPHGPQDPFRLSGSSLLCVLLPALSSSPSPASPPSVEGRNMADVALRSRDLLVSPPLSSWIMTPWHQFWLVHDFWRSEHRSSCTLLSHLHRSYLVF